MSNSSIDFNDKPITFEEVKVQKFEDIINEKDKLEVREYAKALATFISDCDTPMTVGVQGDWGIGKTSMLNTVKAYLESENLSNQQKAKDYGLVWINTWHYSLFGQDEYLGLSVIKGILDQIKSEFDLKEETPAMDKAIGFAKNLIKNAQVSVGGIQLNASGYDSNPDEISFQDISHHMKGFKEALDELIHSIVIEGKGGKKVDRIVFFIDDLDRVKPVKALELLEVLKNFLDIENCIFVLAVDYEVVQMGMEQKYGVDLQKKSGKSFFDKIIQLPFMMPSTSYNLANYIKNLLREIGVKIDDKESSFYDEITTLTVGRNPRSVKRVVNYAKLIRIIRDERTDKTTKDTILQRKIIYSLVCMQIAWPEIFAYFAKSATETTIKQIENWEEQEKIPYINKLYDRTPNLEQLKSNISAFFDLLFELLDEDFDGSLGEAELKPVWDALYVAKLTTSRDFKEPFDIFRDLVKENSSGKSEVHNILESLYKSKWISSGDIEFTLSGKRYVTMIHKRKQIGSLVTLKNRPLIFRLNLDEQNIIQDMSREYEVETLEKVIRPIEESSLTGFGATLIDLKIIGFGNPRIKFLNSLFSTSIQLIKKMI